MPDEKAAFPPTYSNLYHYAGNNPVRYTDPDGRAAGVMPDNFGIISPSKTQDNFLASLSKKILGFSLIGLGTLLDKGGPAIAAAVAAATGGAGAVGASFIIPGCAALGLSLELAGTSIVMQSLAEDVADSNVQFSSNGKDDNSTYDKVKKQRESAPKKGVPSGTRTLDKSNIPKGSHNKIKEGVGNGPKDWTRITPDGDVIINDGYGNAVNCGPYMDYL